jgi:penicillin-binding protein 1A
MPRAGRVFRKFRKNFKYYFVSAVWVGLSLGVVLAALLILWAVNLKMPDFDSFEERVVAQSTKIYDRTGQILLWSIQDSVQRTVVPPEDISRHIKNATVAIEDEEFYEHYGVKPTAIIRALLVNLAAGKTIQGGSTITQQVIKNTLLTTEQKFSRKIKEAVLAVKLERVMSKEDVLALYLNE